MRLIIIAILFLYKKDESNSEKHPCSLLILINNQVTLFLFIFPCLLPSSSQHYPRIGKINVTLKNILPSSEVYLYTEKYKQHILNKSLTSLLNFVISMFIAFIYIEKGEKQLRNTSWYAINIGLLKKNFNMLIACTNITINN